MSVKVKAIVALIIAFLVWGAGSPIFKITLQELSVFTFAFWRFFIPSLLLLPFARQKWQAVTIKEIIKLCMASTLGVVILIPLYFFGLQRGKSINAGLIAATVPLISYFFAILGLHEKPDGHLFKAILIGTAGIILVIISPILSNGASISSDLLANFLFLVAVILMVSESIIAKPFIKKFSTIQYTWVSFTYSSIMFLLMCFLFNGSIFPSVNIFEKKIITGFIWGILGSSLIAHAFYYYGISVLPIKKIGIYHIFNPISATILGYYLLGEKMTIYHYCGGFLALLSIYLAEHRKK